MKDDENDVEHYYNATVRLMAEVTDLRAENERLSKHTCGFAWDSLRAENEHLRALLSPGNDEAVMHAAQAVYDADLVAGLNMTDCERIVDAVMRALAGEGQ